MLPRLFTCLALLASSLNAQTNLLLNPSLNFHCLDDSRGELTADPSFANDSGEAPDFELKAQKAVVPFGFTEGGAKSTKQPNVLGVRVEFTNAGTEEVWLFAPCLTRREKALNRLPISNPRWHLPAKPEPFASEWGAPYGDKQVRLPPQSKASAEFIGTDLSIAYADDAYGGELIVSVDGKEVLRTATNLPFTDASGKALFMENRKGVHGLGYGWHHVEVTAVDKEVSLLGAFTYDTRPNRNAERVERGQATAGETISFSASFTTRPWVICHGGLQVKLEDVTAAGVKFTGSGEGSYEVIGE